MCIHTQMHMTKTISLADDAYEALVAVRHEGESFSELARRLSKLEARRWLFDRARPPLFDAKTAQEFQQQVRRWRNEESRPAPTWS